LFINVILVLQKINSKIAFDACRGVFNYWDFLITLIFLIS